MNCTINDQDNIPFWNKLKDLPIFCGFNLEVLSDGEVKKIPMNSNGSRGLSNVLALHGGRTTLEVVEKLNYPHLGISLMAPIEIQDKYLVCLDFDWKRTKDKKPHPEQNALLQDLMGQGHAYEESYSGHGAHIWMLCNLEDIPTKVHYDNNAEIEIFSGTSSGCKSNVLLTGRRYQGILKFGKPILPNVSKSKHFFSDDEDYFSTVSKEEVMSILLHIPNSGEGQSYDDWIKVGMILKTELGMGGFDLWNEWSEHNDRYRSKDMLYKWGSFNSNESKLGSLIFMAQKYGYTHSGEIKSRPISDNLKKQWFTLEDMQSKLGPIEWMVEDYFEKRSLSIVWGDTQAFKSFIALELCYCIAGGYHWHGKNVSQGAVLYVCGEGSNGIARRLAGLKQKYGTTEVIPLYISNGSRNILDPKEIANIITFGKSLGVVISLIVFDTLNRNFTGDENSSREVATALVNLEIVMRTFNCSVTLIHHGGKDGTKIRGSSAWQNGVDSQYEVKRNSSAFETTLLGFKMKDAELPDPLYFKMNVIFIGNDVTTLVTEVVEYLLPVEETKSKGRTRKEGGYTNTLLDYLRDINTPIHVDELVEFLTTEELTPKYLKQAIKRLEKQGIILIDEKFISLVV